MLCIWVILVIPIAGFFLRPSGLGCYFPVASVSLRSFRLNPSTFVHRDLDPEKKPEKVIRLFRERKLPFSVPETFTLIFFIISSSSPYDYNPREGPVRYYHSPSSSVRWHRNTGPYENDPYNYYRVPEPGIPYSRNSVFETVGKITDTLGALNTIGQYIVNVTRDSKNISNIPKDVPNAIYTLSKNVLGRNITDTIAPFVGEQQIRREIDEVTPPSYVYKTTTESNLQTCTTPDGTQGICDDLSNCPDLLLNLQDLRQSLCFKSLFVPGVCCRKENTITDQSYVSTTTPIPTTTTQFTTTTHNYYPISTTTQFPEIFTLGTNIEAEDCGQQEDEQFRVVGGEEAAPQKWPWVAAIFLHGNRKVEFWCGGSLISLKHILTAAHCTKDGNDRPFASYQLSVRLGDVDLKRTDEPSNPATYRVTQIRRHEKYNRVGYYNDIAVLLLDRIVQRSKYVIPLCLPPPSLRYETFEGRKSTVVGWGSTYYNGKESSVQRQAVIPIWKNDDCNQAYYQPITSHFVCAGYAEGGIDACQGDSGGPLMLLWDTRWLQVGIVSFGNKCGEPGYPGVYTRITEYLLWIKDNMKN
nr:proclotting enzyme isoform X1 [Onthophagus taurus]